MRRGDHVLMKFKLEEEKEMGLPKGLSHKQVVVNVNGDREYVDEVRKLLEGSDKWVLV